MFSAIHHLLPHFVSLLQIIMGAFRVYSYFSRVMSKISFLIYSENKSAGNIAASKSFTIFCGYVVRFVSDLVGNSKDRFSHDADHFYHLQYMR